MKDKTRRSIFGAFVLSGVFILLGFIFIMSGNSFMKESFRYVIYFDDALTGLTVGQPVNLYGVQVGTVKSIQIVGNLDQRDYSIPVVIELNRSSFFAGNDSALFNDEEADEIMLSYIEKGLHARLQIYSYITGAMSIELFFDQELANKKNKKQSPKPAPNVEIHDDFIHLTENSKSGRGYDDLVQIPSTGSSMDEVLSTIATIPFADIALQANETLTEINATLQSLRTILDDGQIQTVLNSTDNLIKSSNSFVRQLNSILQENSTTMVMLAQTLQVVQSASRSITQLADVLSLNPESLIFGKQ